MSYDLQIWSAEPVALPPSSAGWTREGKAWLLAGRKWTTTIWESTYAESEDAPEIIAAAVPGIAWVTELSLHPFDAPTTAVTGFRRLARGLARPLRGAVYDPQTDTADCPPGKRRFVPPPEKEAPAAALKMSWWFDSRSLPTPSGFGELLGLFETLLPEALPRRYGTFEPAEYRYDAGGRPALERFLQENFDDYILWRPNAPVIEVDLALTSRWGSFRDGFRSNYLSVGVDAAVLDQPGWERQLRKFWRNVSCLLQPFYGDVRTLRGYRRVGNRITSHPATTENHPVLHCFWAGLPPTIGHSAVIGPPYTALWLGLSEHAERDGDLRFIEAGTWQSQGDDEAAIAVPPELSDPLPQGVHAPHVVMRLDRPFPKVWPFAAPFDPSRP